MAVSRIHVYHAPWKAVREAATALAPGRELVLAEAAEAIRDAEIVLTSIPPRGAFTAARSLRLVQGMGVGLDHFYPDGGGIPRGVPVACARGLFAEEVAQHAVGVLLAMVLGVPTHVARQSVRVWAPFAHGTLAGAKAVVLGAGAAGSRIAAILRSLRAEVTSIARTAREGVSSDLAGEVRGADVLVVCCARTPLTRGLVSEPILASLARGARVVAVARGGIVDQAALLAALGSGHLGGAALDVFDEEPLVADHPLWTAPNILITPHVAGHGLDYVGHMVRRLLENVRRLENGEPLLDVVDPDRGY